MSTPEPSWKHSTWRIFRLPVLIAIVSGCGLVLALLCDGPIDVVWSCSVAAPLFALLYALLTAKKR